MTGLLLLTVVLAAPDAGVSARTTPAAATRGPDAGRPTPSPDGGSPRADARSGDAGPTPRDGGARASAVDGAPQPSTSIAVQEPAAPDAGNGRNGNGRRKKARADRADGEPDPAMEALLEQSRAQTEALQQIAAQQRAYEEARIADQQARTQRAAQIDGARYSIDSTVQSLQGTGDWNPEALESTRASLQASAAAASAANSPAEATRAAEAARFVQAAQAALDQKNAQQAQYYLLQANQLLMGGGQSGQRVGY